MNFKKTLVLLTLVSWLPGYAQTGPGGVGSSSTLITWLDASSLSLSNGTDVSNWEDRSGNSTDASQGTSADQPTFLTGQINGLPAIDFDGTDFLSIVNASVFDNESDLTWFALAETDNSAAAQCIVSSDYSGGSAFNYKLATVFNQNKHEDRVKNDNGNGFKRNNSLAAGYNLRSSVIAGSSSDTWTRFVNGSLQHTVNLTPFSASTHVRTVIGRNSITNTWFLNGRIPELIIYRDALNSTERSIVENYLAAKYNLTITNDVYAFQATHSNEVAGIGQTSATDNHTDARGPGIVRMSSPSAISDGDYILWGHNGGALTGTTVEFPALMTAAGGSRLTREWVADTTNGNLGTVTVRFDLMGFSLGATPSQYRIMVDEDGNFTDGDTLSIVPTGSTTLTFTGVDFYSGGAGGTEEGPFFTLVYTGNTSDCSSINVFSTNDWTDGPGGVWDCGSTPDSTVNVTISGLTTIQVTGTRSCNDLIVETDATLELSSGATLIVKGDVELQSGATLTCNSNSTIIFRRNDGSIQLVDNSSGSEVTFGSVVSANDDDVRFFGGTFAHTGGIYLNKGNLQNTSTWTFVSDVSGTAHIANVGTGTMTGGSYVMNRFMGARTADWNTITGMGLSTMTLEDIDDDIFISGISGGDGYASPTVGTGSFVSVWKFNNITDAYEAPTSTAGETMSPGIRGYEAWLGDDLNTWTAKAWDATGSALNLSSTAITINGAGGGWNLIGNPFPGFLNWGDIKGTFAVVGNAFWYYDADSAQYNFRSGNTFIPPGQGFWVNSSSSYTMTLTTSMLRSDLSTSEFFKSEPLEEFKVEVKGNDNIFGSAIRIRKDEFAFVGVDEQDIPPLKVPDSRAVNMWMNYAGEEMMVNYINPDEQHVEIPIVIEAGLPGDYTMNFKGLSKFRDFQCMNLYNVQTGDQVEITSKSHYTIKVDEDLAQQHFKILLSKHDYDDCLAPTDLSDEQLRIYGTQKTIVADFFLDRSAVAKLNVYDVLGNLVYTAQETVGYSRENIDLNHVPGGVYFINVDINGTVKSEKVILQ